MELGSSNLNSGLHENSDESFSAGRGGFRSRVKEKGFIIKLVCSSKHNLIEIGSLFEYLFISGFRLVHKRAKLIEESEIGGIVIIF